MLFTVKQDLTLMRDLKLSPRQLTFVKMLSRNYSMDEREWKLQSRAMSLEFQQLSPLTPEELSDMIARDIILDLHDMNDSKIYYDCFEINPKYLKHFTLAVIGMPSELADEYPYEININGDKFFAKSASADEIAQPYIRAINNNPEEHTKVLDDLKWAMKHNKLQCGLKKFVDTKYWLYIRDLKKRTIPINIIDDAKLG